MLQTALTNHIDAHQTQGIDWPAWAEHAVVYVVHTWPCGWEKEPTIRFFASTAELNIWMEAKRDWATLEDNHFAYRAYDWDWGPVPSTTVPFDCGFVPGSKAWCADVH